MLGLSGILHMGSNDKFDRIIAILTFNGLNVGEGKEVNHERCSTSKL